jgi:hypothetical protein
LGQEKKMPFPVDQKWIDDAETRLGAKLPKAYREVMAPLNGGEIEAMGDVWEMYPVWDKSDKKRLVRTCNDIVRETGTSRSCDGFPPNAVAIATNGCGDQLILLPNENDPTRLDETVFFWSHETREIEPVLERVKRGTEGPSLGLPQESCAFPET